MPSNGLTIPNLDLFNAICQQRAFHPGLLALTPGDEKGPVSRLALTQRVDVNWLMRNADAVAEGSGRMPEWRYKPADKTVPGWRWCIP